MGPDSVEKQTLIGAERVHAGLLFGLVALSPLPLGANRVWAWVPLAALSIAIFTSQAIFDFKRPAIVAQDLKRLALPVIAFLLVLIWVAVQAADWAPADWRHPAYGALDVPGAISAHPERTAQFGLRLLGYGAVFWLAVRFGRDPRFAGRGMAVVAISASLLAGYSIIRIIWLGEYGEPISGSFVNRNSFATFAGFGALISGAFLLREMRRARAGGRRTPLKAGNQV